MIIITGPGRSGTSVVAQLYRELGFDPGGQWSSSVRAGWEAPDIVEMNEAIIAELGVEALLRRPGILKRHLYVRNFAHVIKPLLPRPILSKAREFLNRPRDRTGHLSLINWERFDDVVAKYRTKLKEISQSHQVVKDPRFSWMLAVWAAAGAQIDYVVVCIRALDPMVRSRLAAKHLTTKSLGEAKNSLIYGVGACLSALYSYNISHCIIKFPEFLDSAKALYNALRFPQPVSYSQFIQAFDCVVDKSKVNER